MADAFIQIRQQLLVALAEREDEPIPSCAAEAKWALLRRVQLILVPPIEVPTPTWMCAELEAIKLLAEEERDSKTRDFADAALKLIKYLARPASDSIDHSGCLYEVLRGVLAGLKD